MIENLKLPEELLNTPFKDWEHPSLRFDMKEDDEITKHIFFCKTDKQKSFSEKTEPKAKLLEVLEEIQKLPKIENLDNSSKENILNEFSDLMKSLMPHLMLYTGDNSNTIKLLVSSSYVFCQSLPLVMLDDLFFYPSSPFSNFVFYH